MKHARPAIPPPPRPGRKFRRYEVIWDITSRIPRGRVATYGEIAALAGFVGQARLVGYALHRLPADTTVPWHRVINARGGISLTDLDDMYEKQKRLLAKEGVKFVNGRINLARFGWVTGTIPRAGRLHR